MDSYLSQLKDDTRSLYHDIILYLSELGYNPKKEKTSISFKHDLHNKQLVKMGMKKDKQYSLLPVFALRFSACRGYSQRFADIVGSYIDQYPTRTARCISNHCNYCAGKADTHTYMHIFPNGYCKSHCGAYAVEIPDISISDIDEIKKLIKEEHEYLLRHEVQCQ